MPKIAASSALARFRVLDLSRVRAGPTCVRQFADFGADVIKIESPPGVDPNEGMGGPRDGPDMQNLHRNKRSMTLNLKLPEAREVLRAAGEDRRRGGRELPAGRQVPPGHRLRVAGEDQPAHHPRQHLRLRPGRPLPRPAGLRPDRAGHERPHVRDRRSRARADAHRRGDRRRRRRPVRGARHHDRAARARDLGQGPVGAVLAAAGRHRPARLPGRALPDEGRSAAAGGQRPPDQHADLGVQDRRRLHQRRRLGRRHVEAPVQRARPRRTCSRRRSSRTTRRAPRTGSA